MNGASFEITICDLRCKIFNHCEERFLPLRSNLQGLFDYVIYQLLEVASGKNPRNDPTRRCLHLFKILLCPIVAIRRMESRNNRDL